MIQILSPIHAQDCSHLHHLCFDKSLSINEFTDFFDNHLMMLWGYWDNTLLVGLVCVLMLDHEAEIYTLCTHPEYRGRYIACELIQTAKQECLSRLVTNIFLEVAITNISAIKCYEKNNFKIIHTRKNYYTINNESIDAFMMRSEI